MSPSRADWRRRTVFAYLDEPPFCFPGANGPSGCDIELGVRVLKAIGVAEIAFVKVAFAELIPGLMAGRWSLNTPLFISGERARLVDFSRPVWALADGLLMRAGEEARFPSYEALAANPAMRLAVVADQIQERTAMAAGVPVASISRFATQEGAARAVRDGAADAYASVAMAHRGYLKRAADEGLAMVDIAEAAPDTRGAARAAGAFSFAKGDHEFRQAFDAELARIIATDDHRRMMRGYGFSDAETPPLP
ncbi:transporter substrate-binding domain-containing protein [Terrarubrum flagellatum]|uniref:transporter substrate-binding domain-containing protein n=1 Tax=Terrirubrum flagellatum TaxID=2895980 RepID=UPI003144DD3F